MARRPARPVLVAVVVVVAILALAGVLAGALLLAPAGSSSSTSSSASSSTSSSAASSAASSVSAPPVERRLPLAADLLGPVQLRVLGARQATGWRVQDTDDNTSGTGLHSICQQQRFADPQGLAATVRTFRASGAPSRYAVQTVEASGSERRARAAYRRILGWYAGCQAARLQLLDAYAVSGVGDQAEIVSLRLWRRPVTALTVALARTGSVTTTTVTSTGVADRSTPGRQTRLLAEAVRRLCPRNGESTAARSGSPECVSTPRFRSVAPPPTAETPGQLSVADLPPVGRIDDEWVGTRSVAVRGANPAQTTCDHADFSAARVARTRTYLIPEAALPRRFGLTETSGAFRSDTAASRFLAGVRREVRGCERRDLATSVDPERHVAGTPRGSETSVWRFSTRVAADERVPFRLGFVRVGRSVAQLTFTPSARDDMTDAAFDQLLLRAGQRLRGLT